MRIAALGVLMALFIGGGCAPPAEVDEGATVPIAAVAEEPLPPIPQDKYNLRQLERGRKYGYPLERDLASGRFLGGKLEDIIAVYPPDLVLRHDDYTTVLYGNGNPRNTVDGVYVIARNGKLVRAFVSSCVYRPIFFDGLTDDERQAWGTGFHTAFRAHFALPPLPPAAPVQADDAIPPPHEVGKPNP